MGSVIQKQFFQAGRIARIERRAVCGNTVDIVPCLCQHVLFPIGFYLRVQCQRELLVDEHLDTVFISVFVLHRVLGGDGKVTMKRSGTRLCQTYSQTEGVVDVLGGLFISISRDVHHYGIRRVIYIDVTGLLQQFIVQNCGEAIIRAQFTRDVTAMPETGFDNQFGILGIDTAQHTGKSHTTDFFLFHDF